MKNVNIIWYKIIHIKAGEKRSWSPKKYSLLKKYFPYDDCLLFLCYQKKCWRKTVGNVIHILNKWTIVLKKLKWKIYFSFDDKGWVLSSLRKTVILSIYSTDFQICFKMLLVTQNIPSILEFFLIDWNMMILSRSLFYRPTIKS